MSRLLLSLFILPAISAYSVYYVADQNNINGNSLLLNDAPSANHVADVIARLGGHNPILSEKDVHVPTADIFDRAAAHNKVTTVVQLNGGSKIKNKYSVIFVIILS